MMWKRHDGARLQQHRSMMGHSSSWELCTRKGKVWCKTKQRRWSCTRWQQSRGMYAFAQSSLGFMHCEGRGGLPQDFALAAMWWKRAADQGEEHAIKALRRVLDKHLFPPGTAVQLVGMQAAILDGKRGVAVVPGGGAAPPPWGCSTTTGSWQGDGADGRKRSDASHLL